MVMLVVIVGMGWGISLGGDLVVTLTLLVATTLLTSAVTTMATKAAVRTVVTVAVDATMRRMDTVPRLAAAASEAVATMSMLQRSCAPLPVTFL